jgi:hypothetical protein
MKLLLTLLVLQIVLPGTGCKKLYWPLIYFKGEGAVHFDRYGYGLLMKIFLLGLYILLIYHQNNVS